jgi:cytosine/adenosine deaminase-related metal-dependent hydrolase
MGTVLHLHVAEDACDVEDARGRGYDGVIARLEALGALPSGSILAHGVHLAPPEVVRVQELGCWLVHNPRSNAQNRVGYASSLASSDRVALGTDGFRSDMQAERAEGCRLAVENGDVRARIDARLMAGRELVSRWFPELPDTTTARARIEREWPAIEQEARYQAQRLAAAMQQI